MPLRDHFHPPVSKKHRWDAVQGGWPSEIVRQMFDFLPPGFQAEPRIHLGSPTDVDIGTYEDDSRYSESQSDGGVATLVALAPSLTVEADLSEQDQYEVLIYDEELGRQLVAAIEIVSPSNKDRPQSREAFVGKIKSMLRREVCVSIVDLVSERHANLYTELLASLDRSNPKLASPPPNMYAVTLRPRKRLRRRSLLDAWFYSMTVGEPLPTLPIWLSPDLRVMFPLESSYEETCRLLRIA